MRVLSSLVTLGALATARFSQGSVVDDAPLVVVYYDNWAGWLRQYSPSHMQQNFLSRDMPVRNWVFNYAFYTWNKDECSLIPTDSIDTTKGDVGGWTQTSWDASSIGGHIPAFLLLKAQYPHIKLMPSVGGWSRSHTYHDCVANKADQMVDSLVDHITALGWDGIDFDWEYPGCDGAPCGCQNEAVCKAETGFSNQAGPEDWKNYQNFIRKVRARFNELEDTLGRRLYITAAMGMNPKLIDGGNDTWTEGIPIDFICGDEDTFDWVNLMTYDFYGPWAAQTGPLAPLYPNPELEGAQMSIDDSISRFIAKCAKPWKLTMGLATYGKSWSNVPKGDSAVPGLWESSTSPAGQIVGGGTWENGTVSWFDLKKNIIPNCERTWDDYSKTPTLYCASMPPSNGIPLAEAPDVPASRDQKNVFISYEDGESWKAKMEYARAKNMAGAIIWAASDTGSGAAFAPESSADLFEGLFEGWFGEKITLNPAKPAGSAPGTIAASAHYPCPLIKSWPDRSSLVSELSNECASYAGTYTGTEFKVTPKSAGSDLYKDTILIHDYSGTAPGTPETPDTPEETVTTTTVAPVTTTTKAATTTTKAAATTTKTATTTTTKSVTTPAPTQAPGNESGDSGNGDAVSPVVTDCVSRVSSDSAWYIEDCQSKCAFYLGSAWCPNGTNGSSLASCVVTQHPYCTMA